MKTTNKDFMLLCGFEKFDDIYVRIDILERLFLLIFNSEKDDKKEVKVIPEMLNLLGCSKENFNKLLKKMDYKIYEKEKEVFLKYVPSKKKELKKYDKKNNLNNPFNVLNQLNLK
jgi:ATP-dependent RNA helicase SUPV3L1/SUV3